MKKAIKTNGHMDSPKECILECISSGHPVSVLEHLFNWDVLANQCAEFFCKDGNGEAQTIGDSGEGSENNTEDQWQTGMTSGHPDAVLLLAHSGKDSAGIVSFSYALKKQTAE